MTITITSRDLGAYGGYPELPPASTVLGNADGSGSSHVILGPRAALIRFGATK